MKQRTIGSPLGRLTLAVGVLWLAFAAPGAAQASKSATEFRVPTATKTLSNGLIVVVSEDHSAPTVGICVAYGIGFRLEPRGRTGFAHLSEHMMFEGTPVAPKGILDQVIESGGGNNNGDTRYDFTEVHRDCTDFGTRPVALAGSRSHEDARLLREEPGKPAQRGGRGSSSECAEPSVRVILRY